MEGVVSLIKGSEVSMIDADKRQGLALLEIKFEDSNSAKIQKIMEYIKCPIQNIKRFVLSGSLLVCLYVCVYRNVCLVCSLSLS